MHPAVRCNTTYQLGSPLDVTHEIGQIKFPGDFRPFGEELFVGVVTRTGDTGLKYSSSTDEARQKFTDYQKDTETGLDFAVVQIFENFGGVRCC